MERTKSPKCKCGCGTSVKKLREQWNTYIHGHGRHNAVFTKEHKKKLSENKIKFYNKKIPKPILCTCGCEKYTNIYKHKAKKYMHGHNRRGKIFSEQHKQRLSENKKGYILPAESREKISKTLKKFYKNKENHPQWRGGKSTEEYSPLFNNKLKEKVSKIYNRTCQLCKKPEKKEGKKLSVHHIDYNKKNNTLDNLIPLCMQCHTTTNRHRAYWESYFKERKEWSEQNKINTLILS